MEAGGRRDAAAVCSLLFLCLGCFHVIALKPQLFRLGASPLPSETPISYETLYFDQKVSSFLFLLALCPLKYHSHFCLEGKCKHLRINEL